MSIIRAFPLKAPSWWHETRRQKTTNRRRKTSLRLNKTLARGSLLLVQYFEDPTKEAEVGDVRARAESRAGSLGEACAATTIFAKTKPSVQYFW